MSLEKQSSEEIRAGGMNDDALVDKHKRLNEIKHEPTKGFYKLPYFCFRFRMSYFVCSIQLAHTTNDFQLHPPQEIVELTAEERGIAT